VGVDFKYSTYFRDAILVPGCVNQGYYDVILISPPSMGGDKGEGDSSCLFTPTLILPRQGGGDCFEVERKMPRPVGGELRL